MDDRRPVLPEECCSVVDVGRLHFDATSLSRALVRYLKMERVGYRPRVLVDRLAFAAHLVSPLCVELGHFKFPIWLFLRRVGGEVGPALAMDLRLRPGRRSEGILHNRGKLCPAARK
jgi:hypothetical protein